MSTETRQWIGRHPWFVWSCVVLIGIVMLMVFASNSPSGTASYTPTPEQAAAEYMAGAYGVSGGCAARLLTQYEQRGYVVINGQKPSDVTASIDAVVGSEKAQAEETAMARYGPYATQQQINQALYSMLGCH